MDSPQRFNEADSMSEKDKRNDAGESHVADVDAGGDLFDEFAADMAAPAIRPAERGLDQPENARPASVDSREFRGNRNKEETAATKGLVWGWVALTAAIVSLFFYPQILGPVSAVLGVVAYFRGSRTMGIWSVVIGLISLIAYMFLVPYYA